MDTGLDQEHDGMTQAAKRIIGYLMGSADDTLYARLDAAAGMLTHINYAFGIIGPDGRAALDNERIDRDAFERIRDLKARHPHLQVLISLGGWAGSKGFSDAASTAEGRETLAASTIALYLDGWPDVFDGIDIDWEYPVHGGLPDNGYRPEDRRNCTLLFEEYRRQLDERGQRDGRHYLLTAAVPAGRDLPRSTFELKEIAEILDFVNVMTYDLYGSLRTGLTAHNAALRPSGSDPRDDEDRLYANVAGTIETFLADGVPADRLVAGMPFYGRGFTGVPAVNHGLYQPFEDMFAKRYHEIAAGDLGTDQRHWDDDAGVPWLYDPESRTMLTYDDPASIGLKAAYIVEQGLGGAMFWELSGDGEDWPLLSAIAGHLSRG